jgi:acyl-CoA reductase-like NAD-dependent aldehyde dehydrogenase
MAFSETEQTTISPHTQQPYVSRKYPTVADLDAALDSAAKAQKAWARVPLKERIAIGHKFMVCRHRAYVLIPRSVILRTSSRV